MWESPKISPMFGTAAIKSQYCHQCIGCGYHNLTIILIEKVQKDNEKLHERKLFWQYNLRAFHENGGNAHCLKKQKHIPTRNDCIPFPLD